MQVPLDYANPSSTTLDIAIVRSPATGTSRGALVVNPGGPGASGLDYARSAPVIVSDPVRRAFDIIGFDPRGIGESAPIDCMSDADIDALIAMDATPDGPDEVRELERASDLWRCSAPVEGLLDRASTADAARDLDVLRSALGQQHLDYLGVSYGTHLGATYAALFPEHVGRFVLDAPVPAGLDAEELALGQAIGFEDSLRRFVQYCIDGGACPLGDDTNVDAGMARLRMILDALDSSPARTSDPDRPLTEAAATYAILMSLYRVDDRPLLKNALSSLVAGDGSALQRMLDERVGRQSDGTYIDNSFDAFYLISCLDRGGPADIEAMAARLTAVAPFLGEYFAWSTISCDATLPSAQPPALGAAPPMLIVATAHDPATPLAWADILLGEIGNATLLVRDGDGHAGYREGSACTDGAVDAFLLDGVLPKPGTVCD